MLLQCVMCPTVFEAKTRRAKYCSRKCSMRASRAGVAAGRQPARVIAFRDVPGGVEQATMAELSSVGRTESPAGQCALVLARRIDAGLESGGGLAALVREHRAALAEVMAAGEPGESPLDMLRARRQRRLVEELFDYDGGAGA